MRRVGRVAYLLEVPLDGGGELLVEGSLEDVPDGLDLASPRPGEVISRARGSLERALAQLQPALVSVRESLTALSPDETTVEFGIVLGAETGAFVAKGTSEVHFTVTLTWKQPEPVSGPASATDPTPISNLAEETRPSANHG